jgi:hypothetical protein
MTRQIRDASRSWPAGDTIARPVGGWASTKRNVPCGLCGGHLKPGTTVWEIRGMGWVKVRCQACAGCELSAPISAPVCDGHELRKRVEALAARLKGEARDYKEAQGR